MSIANEAAVEAVELDAFAKEIPDLMHESDSLYAFFKANASVVKIAATTAAGGTTRPSFRVPFRVQSGASIAQGTGDGDALPTASGSNYQGFALSPVFIAATNQISWLAKHATEGKERGLVNIQAKELSNSLTSCEQGIEGLLNGDGSGAVDQIPSTATITTGGSGAQTSIIAGLNTVAGFTDQQVVQIFPSIGGTSRGTATISFVDVVAQTLYFSTALPSTGGATAAGDFIMVNGSSGAAGNSLLGLRYWQVNSNSGTIGGLNRANFPGRLSTPVINLNGGAITNNIGQRARTLMIRALGDKALSNPIWYTSLEQGQAIGNLYYNTLVVNAGMFKGSEATADLGKKGYNTEFCGYPLHTSATAQPNRLDLFDPSTWSMGEVAALDLYDFGGGATVFPVIDTNGNVQTSYQFAYHCMFQMANSNPRAGVLVSNAAVPAV